MYWEWSPERLNWFDSQLPYCIIHRFKTYWTPNRSSTFCVTSQDRKQLHILRDSGTSISALTLLFMLRPARGRLSFGVAGATAGLISVLSASGTRQNQLAAVLGSTELVLVPGTSTVPAVWTDCLRGLWILTFHYNILKSVLYAHWPEMMSLLEAMA